MAGDKLIREGEIATTVHFLHEGKFAMRNEVETSRKRRTGGFGLAKFNLQLKLVTEVGARTRTVDHLTVIFAGKLFWRILYSPSNS